MKKKQGIILSVIIIIVFIILISGLLIRDLAMGDLDGDGKKELLLILRKWGSKYGNQFVIISCLRKSGERIQRYPMEDLNPWKVQIADVDGDGIMELSLGVYKTARLDPVMAKRPFLYHWQGNGISPVWLGSRLARPFEEYIFCDINNNAQDELISVEVLENGEKLVNSYMWKGFGFEGLAQSRPFNDIAGLKKTGDGIKVRVKVNKQWKWIRLVLEEGGLTEKQAYDREKQNAEDMFND